MRFGIYTGLEDTTFAALRDYWRAADEIDVYESAWMNDHLLPVFGDLSDPCLEAWVTVTALAQLTKRLRLGFLVSPMTYRHPAILAKMAATLDIVSGGRLELGLGTGWYEAECAAYGIDLMPVKERFDYFEEGCQVITSLLTNDVSNFQGRYFQLVDAPCAPKPIQQPHVPIMIGGTGPKRTLRAVARFGDHWNCARLIARKEPGQPAKGSADEPTELVDEWRRLRDILREHCAEFGRDPTTITTSVNLGDVSEPNALADRAAIWREAGVDVGVVTCGLQTDPGQLEKAAVSLAPLVHDAHTRWK